MYTQYTHMYSLLTRNLAQNMTDSRISVEKSVFLTPEANHDNTTFCVKIIPRNNFVKFASYL